jgi:CHAD domain-containing protein
MKYSLDLDEPLKDEVRRIASGRLTDAAGLLREQPEGLDNAIHDARRHIKQCRALYRLIASGAKDFQKAENERLGDIGRRLSHLRDAKALIEATDYLRHEVPTKSNGLLMDRLAKRLDQRRAEMTTSSAEAADALESAGQDLLTAADAVDGLTLSNARRKSAGCLSRGWETVGRKARAAIKASGDGDEEAFHDMRKRTQDRWMHAALMRDLWPSALAAIHRQGKMLSDRLGQAQDLAILLDAVAGSSELVTDAVESEAIRDLVVAQQEKLHRECRELATALFDKSKPRDGVMIERLLLDR